MIGQRQLKKKSKTEKKQWEKEYADEDSLLLENQQFKEQNEDSQSENPIQAVLPPSGILEKEKEKEKEKEFEWMDSGDEQDEELESEKQLEMVQEQPPVVKNIDTHDPDRTTVFVENLHFELTDQAIRNHFQTFGSILSIEVARNDGAIFNKGRAFIEYSTEEEANRAMQANGTYFRKRKIKVTVGLVKAAQKQQYIKQALDRQQTKLTKMISSESESSSSNSISRSRSESSGDDQQEIKQKEQ